MGNERSNRTVTIDADGSGLVSELSSIEQVTERIFDNLNQKTQDWGKSLDNIITKLDAIIDKLDKTKSPNDGGGGGGGGGMGGGMVKGLAQGVGAGVGLAAFTSIGNAIGAVFSEGKARSRERAMLGGMTGDGNMNAGDLSSIGMTESQGWAATRSISQSRGKHDADAAKNQLFAERAMGMETGSTTGLNKFSRSGGADVDDTMKMVLKRAFKSDLWDIKVGKNGEIEGMTGMKEVMERVAQLNEVQMGIFERISTEDTANVVNSFAQLGGAFGDDSRANSRIMSVHQAITNPNNQYIDAMMKTALAAENPNMSMVELEMRQREGVFGEDNFETIMNHISERYQGDDKTKAIMNTFSGLDNDSIVRLANLTKEDYANMRDSNMGINEYFESKGGKPIDFKGKGKDATGKVEIIEAKTLNLAGGVGEKIIDAISPHVNDMLDAITALINGKNDTIAAKLAGGAGGAFASLLSGEEGSKAFKGAFAKQDEMFEDGSGGRTFTTAGRFANAVGAFFDHEKGKVKGLNAVSDAYHDGDISKKDALTIMGALRDGTASLSEAAAALAKTVKKNDVPEGED